MHKAKAISKFILPTLFVAFVGAVIWHMRGYGEKRIHVTEAIVTHEIEESIEGAKINRIEVFESIRDNNRPSKHFAHVSYSQGKKMINAAVSFNYDEGVVSELKIEFINE